MLSSSLDIAKGEFHHLFGNVIFLNVVFFTCFEKGTSDLTESYFHNLETSMDFLKNKSLARKH